MFCHLYVDLPIPLHLVYLRHALRGNIKTEGVFRRSTSTDRTSELLDLIDSEPVTDINFDGFSALTIADVLKKYFHLMPKPLFPMKLYAKILTESKKFGKMDQDFKEENFTRFVDLLPTHNKQLLTFLMDTIIEVAASVESNKMDLENLSKMFAPNVLRAKKKLSPLELMEDGKYWHLCLLSLTNLHLKHLCSDTNEGFSDNVRSSQVGSMTNLL